jgi:hypothetical protein
MILINNINRNIFFILKIPIPILIILRKIADMLIWLKGKT